MIAYLLLVRKYFLKIYFLRSYSYDICKWIYLGILKNISKKCHNEMLYI